MDYIAQKAKELNLEPFYIHVLTLKGGAFDICTGSGRPDMHHYGVGGLKQHTTEVMQLCFSSMQTLGLQLNEKELFLSVLYHDVGKMWDYDYRPTDIPEWVSTDHKKRVYHICRSAIEWNLICCRMEITPSLCDNVTHNILAHHCLPEWKSPVSPQSREAWLLHLCDGISARMDDNVPLDSHSTR